MSIGAAVGASIIGGMYSDYRARKEADKNRNWQANMSNTSHYREVQDLRRAGLNPILSANAGASTPTGSMAPVTDMSSIGSTALEAKRLKADLELMEENKNLIRSQKNKTDVEALMLKKGFPKMDFENKVYEAFMAGARDQARSHKPEWKKENSDSNAKQQQENPKTQKPVWLKTGS